MTASPTDDLASAERRIQELTKELLRSGEQLAEARDQQAATAEILRAISNSPVDSQHVFSEIVASAVRLCDAHNATIYQVDGHSLRRTAHHGSTRAGQHGQVKLPLTRGSVAGRAVLDRRPVHVVDLQAEGEQYPDTRDFAQRLEFRSILAVPLIRAGATIGVISIRRTEVRPFTDRQIELLKTFADQAVIAIENVRLFTETKESLAQQTAAAEVLNVISNSVADPRPVFASIATACQALFDSDQVVLSLVDDAGLVRHERGEWPPHVSEAEAERQWAALNASFPRPLAQSYQSYPLRKRRVVHYPDMLNGPGLPESMRQIPREIGNFSALIAPMQTETKDLGTIHVVRKPPRPFSNKEAALLKTFADQAVIAIENTRLFEEVQARTRELTDALRYQTATSDVLNVMSRSKFDLQPVLDIIAEGAAQLCAAHQAAVFRYDSELMHLGALVNNSFAPGRDFVPWRFSDACCRCV